MKVKASGQVLIKIDKVEGVDKESIILLEPTVDSIKYLRIPKYELIPQPLNKECISCGGYTLIDIDDYPHDEHSKKFCFMCLFWGKADELKNKGEIK